MKRRILVTGIGGPAGIGCLQSMCVQDVFVGDMNPRAPGIFLVPPERRLTLLPGDHPQFTKHLLTNCIALGIDTIMPTVDSEMLPIARDIELFRSAGVTAMVASAETLRTCLDKFQFFVACHELLPLPQTAIFDRHFNYRRWRFPLVVKPRRGSGSRGVVIAQSAEDLERLERSAEHIVQEYLPGREYSVDVLVGNNGRMLTAVPRVRIATDSGVSVCSATVRDSELIELSQQVCQVARLRYANNIQFRRDRSGQPRLLEINPRIPGTVALTVAAGVNLPKLALDVLDNKPISKDDLAFEELGVVRYLTEVFVDTGELLEYPDYESSGSTESILL